MEQKSLKWIKWIEIGLVALFLGTGLIVALSSEFAVLQWYLTDDAFYYFKVAQNIGEGLGSTFDGVNPTNGYHPLWMLVCVPVFLLARVDLVLPLRILILVASGFGAASAVILFRMLRRFLELPIALAFTTIWAFYLPLYRVITKNGMEAAISAFFIILLWERVTALNQQEKVTIRQIWVVGGIAVFTFLSRLDNIFLVFFAGVWVWLRWWQPMTEAKTTWASWRWRLKTGVAFYLPVTVVLLVYLGLNQWLFNSAMPISSEVKLWWGTLGKTIYGSPLYIYPEYIFEYLLPASRGVGPWEPFTRPLHEFAIKFWAQRGRDFTLEPLAITYAAVFGAMAAVLAPGWKRLRQLGKGFGLLPLFAAAMVQSSYYFYRDATNLQVWYWVSQNLFLLIMLAVAVSVIFGYFSKFKQIEIARWVFAGGVALMLCFGIIDYAVDKTYSEVGDYTHEYQQRANLLRTLIPPDAVLAGIGTGSVGYFMPDHRVVNLDGLINSAEYLEHLKNGTVIDFLEEMDVQYIYGSPYIVTESKVYGGSLGPYLEFVQEYEISQNTQTLWRVVYP